MAGRERESERPTDVSVTSQQAAMQAHLQEGGRSRRTVRCDLGRDHPFDSCTLPFRQSLSGGTKNSSDTTNHGMHTKLSTVPSGGSCDIASRYPPTRLSCDACVGSVQSPPGTTTGTYGILLGGWLLGIHVHCIPAVTSLSHVLKAMLGEYHPLTRFSSHFSVAPSSWFRLQLQRGERRAG